LLWRWLSRRLGHSRQRAVKQRPGPSADGEEWKFLLLFSKRSTFFLFFFEKKNQKTFIPNTAGVQAIDYGLIAL
jgi:hypothetical protein